MVVVTDRIISLSVMNIVNIMNTLIADGFVTRGGRSAAASNWPLNFVTISREIWRKHIYAFTDIEVYQNSFLAEQKEPSYFTDNTIADNGLATREVAMDLTQFSQNILVYL